jgi:hypothetical protein
MRKLLCLALLAAVVASAEISITQPGGGGGGSGSDMVAQAAAAAAQATANNAISNRGVVINGFYLANGTNLTIVGGGISNVIVNGMAGVVSAYTATVALVAADVGAVSNNHQGIAAAGGMTNGQLILLEQFPYTVMTNSDATTLNGQTSTQILATASNALAPRIVVLEDRTNAWNAAAAHTNRTDNPHAVTAAQVGAVSNTDSRYLATLTNAAAFDPAGTAGVVQVNLDAHTNLTLAGGAHGGLPTPAAIGAVSNTAAGVAAAGGVTNNGITAAAGANITLNGSSSPVALTNGTTLTIASTATGGGGLSNVVISGMNASSTGVVVNSTSSVPLTAWDIGAASNTPAGIAAAGGLTNGAIPAAGCTDLGTSANLVISGATTFYEATPVGVYTVNVASAASRWCYSLIVYSTNSYTLASGLTQFGSASIGSTNEFCLSPKTNGGYYVRQRKVR